MGKLVVAGAGAMVGKAAGWGPAGWMVGWGRMEGVGWEGLAGTGWVVAWV